MKLTHALIASAAVITLAGCGSMGGSAAGQPSGSEGASAAALAGARASQSSAAAAAASQIASAASAPCTSHACIASELDQSLVGAIAEDDAVATKARCKAPTVKNHGSGNYTAWCTVYYSDGSSAEGTGTVDTSAGKVLFEPSGD